MQNNGPQYKLAGKSNTTFSKKINRFDGIIKRWLTHHIQSRDISIRHFQKRREIFTPVLHTINRKTWCKARVWSLKAGKISENRNKQTSDQEHEKNCIVPERKEIRAVCVSTSLLFNHSLSSRLSRWKMVMFFFCSASKNFLNWTYLYTIRTIRLNIQYPKNVYKL